MPSAHRSQKPALRALEAERPLGERDDDALMLLASQGLSEAFGVLVARHQRALRNFCARSTGDARAGDDIAQEVFVTLWRQRRAYEPRGRFKSYLFTIALGRAKNERRARRRRAEEPATSPRPETTSEFGSAQLDALEASERARRLHELVAKLPEEQAEAIRLRYSAELAYAEIAALTDEPEATVRSRVFLGLKHLKRLIGRKMP